MKYSNSELKNTVEGLKNILNNVDKREYYL